MWAKFIVEDNFLKENHFNLLKEVSFNTDSLNWEIYKHKIFLDNSVKITYKNNLNIASSVNPLAVEDVLDIHNTYHELMMHYLDKLCPQKVDKYKFTELNLVCTGKDYKFPIHNDSVDKLLSAVIYISPENNKGTILYENKEALTPIEVKWKQNRVFIFSRNKDTWHSYESDNFNQRVTLVYNLRG